MKNYSIVILAALLAVSVSCSKSDPEPKPTIDPTSIDAFNTMIFEDYHSVVDTVADIRTLRLLYEAQATFNGYLDEINGEPKMESFYCVVELQYKDESIKSYKISHDLLKNKRTIEEEPYPWLEDYTMAVVPAITLRGAYDRLKAAGKLPHTSVVTLREHVLWRQQGEFDCPQYIFGNGIIFVDSLGGQIAE